MPTTCANCNKPTPCVSVRGMTDAGWKFYGPWSATEWRCPDCPPKPMEPENPYPGVALGYLGEPVVAAIASLVGLYDYPRHLCSFVVECNGPDQTVNVYVKQRVDRLTEEEVIEKVGKASGIKLAVDTTNQRNKFLRTYQPLDSKPVKPPVEVADFEVKPDCTVTVMPLPDVAKPTT